MGVVRTTSHALLWCGVYNRHMLVAPGQSGSTVTAAAAEVTEAHEAAVHYPRRFQTWRLVTQSQPLACEQRGLTWHIRGSAMLQQPEHTDKSGCGTSRLADTVAGCMGSPLEPMLCSCATVCMFKCCCCLCCSQILGRWEHYR